MPNISIIKRSEKSPYKKKDISFTNLKKSFNLLNKSSDNEKILNEPNELKILKKKSTYDIKDDSKFKKKESGLNKSHTVNRNSLMDVILPTSNANKNNTLSKIYLETEIQNRDYNNKFIIKHENELTILKRQKSQDLKNVIDRNNSNDTATFDKKNSNKYIKNSSLIHSLESTTFNVEFSKKLDISERIQSISYGKQGIKNLLSEESIKVGLDMNVESIEDLHINFVFLINKSKMIVKKHEGFENGDIMSTVHFFEETDI